MCADPTKCECEPALLPGELGAVSLRCVVCCTWREYPDAPCLCEVLHEDDAGREHIDALHRDAVEAQGREMGFQFELPRCA